MSNRLCYFIAVAAGQEISSIFQTVTVDSLSKIHIKVGGTQRITACGIEFITMRVMSGATPQSTSSTETSGKWDIYQIIPVLDDKKSTKDFYKALDAAQKSNANKVSTKRRMLGPWTAPQFAKLIWVGEKICYEQEPDSIDANGIPSVSTHKKPGAKLQLPWAIAGDDPIELAKEDYDGKEAK